MECKVCHNCFEPKHWNQKICSEVCVNKQLKKRKHEHRINNIQYYNDYMNTYNKTIQFKISHKMFRQSSLGKEWKRRSNYKRRSLLNNIIETFTSEEWLDMKNRTKGVCPHCNRDVGINNITLDHIYAISLANIDFLNTGIKRIYTIKDIQPLCKRCNSSKSSKAIELEVSC